MTFFQFIYSSDLVILFLVVGGIILLWQKVGEHSFIKSKTWQLCNLTLAIISICIILYITLLGRNHSESEIVLIPMSSFIEARTQPELYREMFMNVLLFIPFGLFVPYALDNNTRSPNKIIIITIFNAFGLSIGIEFFQYTLKLGRSEIDDVIFNTLGALVGLVNFWIQNRDSRLNLRKKY